LGEWIIHANCPGARHSLASSINISFDVGGIGDRKTLGISHANCCAFSSDIVAEHAVCDENVLSCLHIDPTTDTVWDVNVSETPERFSVPTVVGTITVFWIPPVK
jgi:hypothetical protein